MKRYKFKSKNIFLYKIALVMIITVSIFFAYFSTYINSTEYYYDFENDAINSFPIGFVGIGRTTVHTKVVGWDHDDGHAGKVVQISYLDTFYTDSVDYAGIELNTLFSKANEGFISFDIYLVEELGIAIDVCQEDPIWDSKDDICIRIAYQSTYVMARDVRDSLINVLSPALKLCQWYHFQLEFNCQKNEWSVMIYKEMVLLGSMDFQFNIQPSYLCQLYFATYTLGNEFYIDNVRISLNNIISQ